MALKKVSHSITPDVFTFALAEEVPVGVSVAISGGVQIVLERLLLSKVAGVLI
jgi:hypothetical protein